MGVVFVLVATVGAGCGSNHLGPFPTGLAGLKAVRTIDDDFGACLKLVGVRVGHGANGQLGDQSGVPGIVITLHDAGVSFFVNSSQSTASQTASPVNRAAQQMIARAEGISPGCAGKPSGTLPPDFAAGP
jgi:hypothetical protein